MQAKEIKVFLLLFLQKKKILPFLLGPAGLAGLGAVLFLAPTAFANDRAEALNAQLTLDERIALVHGVMAIPANGMKLPDGVQISAGYIPGIPRLGIPPLTETDASLGVANPSALRPGDGATALPSGLALAATFDPDMAFEGGAMIGAEARARGFDVLLAGGVNLARDPRNGRNFEYLGEDPLLAGTLAGQSVRGIQSNGIISTVKHYVLNDQETHRHFYDAAIDSAALRESDLLAFEIAIGIGHPGAVMCSYNLIWGRHACGNGDLLTGVLKGDWHYPGFVMADWGATYGVLDARAGLDQESGEQLDAQPWFGAPLKQAVLDGEVPASRLADMTLRILRSMDNAGLLGRNIARAPADESGHLAVARREAAAGLVLLRNEGGLLPLRVETPHILVVGGHADLGVLSGGGSSQVYPAHFDPAHKIPLGGDGGLGGWRNMVFQSSAPLAAIRARAPRADVVFDDGRYPALAAARAKHADVVIVFANQWMCEDEDVPDLSLPQGQDALIEAVAAANPHTVVVLETGGPVSMNWLRRTASVVEAWYPGAGGADAIADVLFGVVNPSGHLPITFPEDVRQLPRPVIPGWMQPDGHPVPEPHAEGADVGYRYFARTGQTPLFPFGYGLSFTNFAFANPRIEGGDTVSVSVDVTNTGAREGKVVPQLYLTEAAGEPKLRLLGFAKISLRPGETRSVRMTADPRLLAHFDTALHGWRRRAGVYRVAIGSSSASLPLTAAVTLSEARLPP
jgi:beta-glucosidase